MFMYFLLPHWVPATWRSRAQTSMRAELPSGKVRPLGLAANIPVQPLDHIVGTNPGPMLRGKVTVSQGFLNTALHHLRSGLDLCPTIKPERYAAILVDDCLFDHHRPDGDVPVMHHFRLFLEGANIKRYLLVLLTAEGA